MPPVSFPSPREVIHRWVEAFNRQDIETLLSLYHPDAVNHQVAEDLVQGADNLRRRFEQIFALAPMTCLVENIFQDEEWAMLEWRDPLGLRGCGFFHITAGRIRYQRGYWDKLTFLRQHHLPLPKE